MDYSQLLELEESPQRVDEVGGGITYVGFTPYTDALDSDAKWSVKKVTEVGGLTTIQYADGKRHNFVNAWDDRAALTYV